MIETKYHFVLTFSKSQESKRVRVKVKVWEGWELEEGNEVRSRNNWV